PLLQHRLSTGDLDQSIGRAQTSRFIKDLLRSHLLPAVKTVFGIAPRAAQVAPGQPHEYARQPRISGFPLERLVDFGDLHRSEEWSSVLARQSLRARRP